VGENYILAVYYAGRNDVVGDVEHAVRVCDNEGEVPRGGEEGVNSVE